MTTAPPTGPAPRAGDRPSIGELIAGIAESTANLVRHEIELAKAEIQEKAAKAGIGAGLFVGAGLFAFFAFATLVATLVLAFATFLPAWLAALIVTVILLAIAALLAFLGKRSIAAGSPPTPDRAIASVKEDIAAVRASVAPEGETR